MMQAAAGPPPPSSMGGMAAASPSPVPRNDELLVPNLNNYVRGRLSKTEVPAFSDCARALGECCGP